MSYFDSDNYNKKFIKTNITEFADDLTDAGDIETLLNNLRCEGSYSNQKLALAWALKDKSIVEYSAGDYHNYVANNADVISSDYVFGKLINNFKNYLNKYLNSFITFKTGVMYDKQTNIRINNPIMFMKPVLRFFNNYKLNKMSYLFNFSKFIKLKETEPNNKIFELPELKELDKIINRPCLFLTFTMGSDKPLETVLKYKSGWKKFYNNLRNQFLDFGLNMDYYIKGVEFTKNNRLHIHLLVLDVNIEPLKLIEFKKGVENNLKLAEFGYINDITYLKEGKTYLLKSKTDLHKLKNDNNNRFKNIKVLKSFKLDFKGGVSLFNLIEATYNHKKEFTENNASKIINYVLKYILKGDAFDNLETEKEKDFYLKNNILFWLTGVKKFNISRKLSNLLNTFNDAIIEKRFIFFSNDDDFLKYASGFKPEGAEFRRGFIGSEAVEGVNEIYKYTASGLYASLSLPVPEFLLNLRFKTAFNYDCNIINVAELSEAVRDYNILYLASSFENPETIIKGGKNGI